jgi:hypothetical protein
MAIIECKRVKKRKGFFHREKAFQYFIKNQLVHFEPLSYFIVMHNFFFEGIRSALGRFHHLNHLSVVFTTTGLQGCYNFLCHGCSVILFDFFMHSHASKNWIEFLLLQTLWCVFTIFCGYVAASAW